MRRRPPEWAVGRSRGPGRSRTAIGGPRPGFRRHGRARYRKAQLHGAFRHDGGDLVAFFVRTGNAAALRGVARRLFRVAEEQRTDVAAIALQALLTNPRDSDGAAAYHIYRTLGPKAGLALLRTGNDEIARGVARAWRWTLDDGIFDALRSHPREYVRRKMVPRGTEDEQYRFTDEEVERLKSAVIPVMLRDRAKLVRERAQDLLDALSAVPSEADSPVS